VFSNFPFRASSGLVTTRFNPRAKKKGAARSPSKGNRANGFLFALGAPRGGAKRSAAF
jgi:hypothetical protein